MQNSAREFDTIDDYIQDEIKQLETMFKMPLTEVDRKLGVTKGLSKKMPKKYPKLEAADNVERLKVLSRIITNKEATDEEWEEYGWRMVGR